LDVERWAFDVFFFPMRILMISAEGPPLARATALVDVLEALPRELRARKHEVGVVMPFYREISENMAFELRDTGITVDVRLGAKNHVAEFVEGRTAAGVQMFFIRCDEFFAGAHRLGKHGRPRDLSWLSP
jgi:starch synthase